MPESTYCFTTDERNVLVELLETTKKQTLVEEHRTRSPSFREHITEREELIERLLQKLREPAGV
jgi:hypothetical protein